MKTLASNPITGLYFKMGSGFSVRRAFATALDENQVAVVKFTFANVKEEPAIKSFAERIHSGEITREEAAKEYVQKAQRDICQKSFAIRVADGKYVSRVVKIEKKGVMRCAYINYKGQQIALAWSMGELATGWAC